MKLLTLIPYYLVWHYTAGTVGFFKIWSNLIWFLNNFFSFNVLLRTLFSPFKRLNEKYGGGLDLGKLFEAIVISVLMRIVGFIMRIVTIVIGVVAIVCLLVLGLFAFIIWLLLPFIIIFLLISGYMAAFRNSTI